MRYIVLSDIPPGVLVNIQDEVGLRIAREIGLKVFLFGKVGVLDPNNAIFSRMKHPWHHLRDEIHFIAWRLMGYTEEPINLNRDERFRTVFETLFHLTISDGKSPAGSKMFIFEGITWDEMKEDLTREMNQQG